MKLLLFMADIISIDEKLEERERSRKFVESIIKMIKNFDENKLDEIKVAPPGKTRILEIISSEGQCEVIDDYDSHQQAIMMAEGMSREALRGKINRYDKNIPMYLAYNDQGEYVGGAVLFEELDSEA